MNRSQYGDDPEVEKIIYWLAEVIEGSRPIDFIHAEGRKWESLSDCLASYAWPPKKNPGLKPDHRFPTEVYFTLDAHSSLAENDAVLNRLSNGLKTALCSHKSHDLEPWILSIFQWGGMLAGGIGKSNRTWIDAYRHELFEILDEGCQAFRKQTDDAWRPDYRFNASMTKIYSLLLEDCVIYDSRVGAALAWLINRYYQDEKRQVPEYLRFAMPPGRSFKRVRNPKPGTDGFPMLRSGAAVHYVKWNVRANWILSTALSLSCKKQNTRPMLANRFSNLREVEAALFTMGQDLTHAL